MLEICLNETYVRQMRAEMRRLVDCVRVVGTEDICAGFSCHFAVSPAPTAGIEDTQPFQRIERDARFCLKGRAIFVVVSHLVLVPLQAKAFEMVCRDKSGDAVHDGPLLFTGGA